MKNKKLPSLPLFTDTFAAETVHLTNEAVGIYIRLLSFAWTKNAKPFKTESAYRICQCRDDNCCINVYEVLEEFFILTLENKEDRNKNTWTHKRLTAEHEYLTEYYQKKSNAGRKGAIAKKNFANSKTEPYIPIPIPIPKSNNIDYDSSFSTLWKSLNIKRGSKHKSHQLWLKLKDNMPNIKETAKIYNQQQSEVEAKFVPHFATWLSQRRWEIDEKDQNHQESPANLRTKMEKLGFSFRHSEDHFDYFKKDGKEYKIDRYDKEHIIHNVE